MAKRREARGSAKKDGKWKAGMKDGSYVRVGNGWAMRRAMRRERMVNGHGYRYGHGHTGIQASIGYRVRARENGNGYSRRAPSHHFA